MKKQAYTMVGMIVLLGCMAVSARAQCARFPAIANIPFQFSIGKATLPSGEYKVTCYDPNGRVVVIRSTDGKVNGVMQMVQVSRRSQDSGKLVFRRYGNRYFFSQAWTGGGTGLELPATHAERTVARELAGIKPKIETTALSGRR